MSTIIRKQLVKHLKGGEAFMPVDKLIGEITWDKLGKRPTDLPYSFYEVFYHIYYTQKDILNFCKAESYATPNWPDDYWPKTQAPKTEQSWKKLIVDYQTDRKELVSFLQTDKNELEKPVRHGKDGQTLIREMMLVIEHTAYHTGQLLVILRCLGLHTS